MEEETMFLFVSYSMIEIKHEVDPNTGKEIRDYGFRLKRAAMQKEGAIQEGSSIKRIAVDFDPLEHQQCYIVIALFKTENRNMIMKNQPKIVGVFLSEKEAIESSEKIQAGGHKDFRDKKEEYSNTIVCPAIITVN
jgi:hypothetical protein